MQSRDKRKKFTNAITNFKLVSAFIFLHVVQQNVDSILFRYYSEFLKGVRFSQYHSTACYKFWLTNFGKVNMKNNFFNVSSDLIPTQVTA